MSAAAAPPPHPHGPAVPFIAPAADSICPGAQGSNAKPRRRPPLGRTCSQTLNGVATAANPPLLPSNLAALRTRSRRRRLTAQRGPPTSSRLTPGVTLSGER